MEIVPVGGGSVPPLVPAHQTFPVLDGGTLVGHGGAALRVFVGLSLQQNHQLEQMGQLEAPRGRRNEYYWPLKTDGQAAMESAAAREDGSGTGGQVVLRPISVTYVGFKEMVCNGTLYSCDGMQFRLYAPLRMPGPRDAAGAFFYEVHPPYTV